MSMTVFFDRLTKRMLWATVYAGVGFAAHATWIGAALDFHNAWTYAYVLAWPILALSTVLVWFGYVVLACIVGCFVCFAYIQYLDYQTRTQRKRRKSQSASNRPKAPLIIDHR